MLVVDGRSAQFDTHTKGRSIMTEHDIQKESAEASTGVSGTSAAEGLANEAVNQLNDFLKKPSPRLDNDSVATFIEFERPAKSEMSDKTRKEAIDKLGTSLADMLKGELPALKEMLQRNGITDTSEVDAKIEAAEKTATAAKPLQDAVLSGNIAAIQNIVAQMKPEELAQHAELLNKHFDKAGIGIELDATGNQLIVSRSNGDRAVAISKDKTDVIGVNADGSYDFNRHYRHENPGNEVKSIADDSLNNYLNPPRQFRDFHHEVTTMAIPEGGMVPREWEQMQVNEHRVGSNQR